MSKYASSFWLARLHRGHILTVSLLFVVLLHASEFGRGKATENETRVVMS